MATSASTSLRRRQLFRQRSGCTRVAYRSVTNRNLSLDADGGIAKRQNAYDL